MLEIHELNYSFKQERVLDNINLYLENGITGLLGPNGAGKTTLFRCICGIYENYKGEILISNEKKYNISHKIGYLPQNFSVMPYIKVYDIMYYYASLKGINKTKRDGEIKKALELVNLEQKSNIHGNNLSGGMIRRLGIAIAVMGNPEIIIMDEPTVGLDPEERLKFIGLIKSLCDKRLILFSTHIVDDLRGNCDNIIILKKGRLLFSGSEKELCTWGGTERDSNNTLEEGYFNVIKSKIVL